MNKPSFGVLTPPVPRSADYLKTLHEWGELPEVVPALDVAALLASLCGQNKAALVKVLGTAIMRSDIKFWGLSHDGGWREDMIRFLHPVSGKPKVRPRTESRSASAQFSFESMGRLHIEAMGVRPSDAVALLVKRGRRIPLELQDLMSPNVGAELVHGTPKPVQRQRSQKEAILAKLVELGYTPTALPKPASGKASRPKQEVKAALGYTNDVMKKAWQWLRDDGLIKDD
ncbi:MAG: hypothetical protein K2Y02_02805 [Burkholderiaceae bacterium]|nr:hypothetical protein [Burkholderiaceae bacterium]